MKVTTLGIDLAKNTFQLHGIDQRGVAVLRKRLTRQQLVPFLTKLSPCLVGIEACGGAHFWAREISRLGHQVRMMSPHLVRPYRKSSKNDSNDAEAICEAVGRPSMRFVPAKSQAQQDVQAIHRIRAQLIKWGPLLLRRLLWRRRIQRHRIGTILPARGRETHWLSGGSKLRRHDRKPEPVPGHVVEAAWLNQSSHGSNGPLRK